MKIICEFCNKPFNTKNSKQKFCCAQCFYDSRKNKVKKKCLWCDKTFWVINSRKNTAKFCSRSHMALYRSCLKYHTKRFKKEPSKIRLDKNICYLLGVITSDGTLHKTKNNIKIASKDLDWLHVLRSLICNNITGTENKIYSDHKILNNHDYICYSYAFSSNKFYNLCLQIGLFPNKSLYLKKLSIPPEYFGHFLRGLIDGDGNFNILKRTTKSGCVYHIQIRLYSGAYYFICWIQNTLKTYNIKTSLIRKNYNNCYVLMCTYNHGVNTLLQLIYNNADGLYLKRKYNIIYNTIKLGGKYSLP